jgi:hypothetical protein
MGVDLFDGYTKEALELVKEDLQKHQQVHTGEPIFDELVGDIWKRIINLDPKLGWDDATKPIVGLYDQVTHGAYQFSRTDSRRYPREPQV